MGEFENLYKEAIADKGNVAEYCSELFKFKYDEIVEYADLWKHVNGIFDKYGFDKDDEVLTDLAASLAVIDHEDSEIELPKFLDRHKILDQINSDDSFREEFFDRIIASAEGYYVENAPMPLEEDWVHAYADLLSSGLEVYGYGKHFDGAMSALRFFANEGYIAMEMYEDDVSHKELDEMGAFGHYSDNGDNFWAGYDSDYDDEDEEEEDEGYDDENEEDDDRY